MPKSQLDWLAVILLWFGAAVLTVKSGDLPLVAGAPTWLAASWWNFVPLVLISFFLLIATYRLVSKPTGVKVDTPAPEPKPVRTGNDYLARSRALDDLRRVSRASASILKYSKTQDAQRELPELRAALLTAYKVFNIPRLPDAKDALAEHYLAKAYMDRVLPYLEKKHDDEAKIVAQEFIDEAKAHPRMLKD